MGACTSKPIDAGTKTKTKKKKRKLPIKDSCDLRNELFLKPRAAHGLDQSLVSAKDISDILRYFRNCVRLRKLAPFWASDDDRDGKKTSEEEGEEEERECCQICLSRFESLNETTCCKFSICTECHFRQSVSHFTNRRERESSKRGKGRERCSNCPCCRKVGYEVKYYGVKSAEERERASMERDRCSSAMKKAIESEKMRERERQSRKESVVDIDDISVPKGWEEEYRMAALAERGSGSPSARADANAYEAQSNFRNSTMSSGFRSTVLSDILNALSQNVENSNRSSSRQSFDRGRRRRSEEFRRNSLEYERTHALPTPNEPNQTVEDFRNMVLEELYLSEAIYRSMLDLNDNDGTTNNSVTEDEVSSVDINVDEDEEPE